MYLQSIKIPRDNLGRSVVVTTDTQLYGETGSGVTILPANREICVIIRTHIEKCVNTLPMVLSLYKEGYLQVIYTYNDSFFLRLVGRMGTRKPVKQHLLLLLPLSVLVRCSIIA